MVPSAWFRIGCWSFVGGTAIGLFFDMSLGSVLLIAAMGISGAFVFSFIVRKWSLWRVFSVAFFLFGIFALGWNRSSIERQYWSTLPETVSVMRGGTVIRDPVLKDRSVDVVASADRCDGSCPDAFILVSLPPFSDVRLGDRIEASCLLARPKSSSSDFEYPMYLAKDGIGYECRFPKEWLVREHSSNTIRSGISYVRDSLELGARLSMPEPESGLLAGLLLGGDARLPRNIRDEFSRTGLSHIVAVSGYNVTMIAVILMGLLVVFGLWRQEAYWVAFFGLVFFTVLVGAPSSATRALIMAGLALSAKRIGRVANPQNVVLSAAVGMLFLNPLLLRYDIGFQLSFLATIGILVVAPLLLVSFRFGDILATTVAAELFVLPIILMNFHAFPVVSLLANLLVLPVVPFAMLFGFVGMIIGVVFPVAATIVGFPGFLCARYILFVIDYLSQFPFASLSVPSFGVGFSCVWYAVLFGILFFLKRRGWFDRANRIIDNEQRTVLDKNFVSRPTFFRKKQ